jgi:nitroreductase
MDILDVIKGRRSIRSFRADKIPDEIVEQLKEALIWAPSAGNLQSRKFYFVFNEKIKKALVGAALNQDFIAQAPLAIVACADYNIQTHYGSRGSSLYMLQDVAAGIQNLMLLAHSHGLGTAWVGAFHEEEVSKILNIPDNLRPVAIIPIGYPDESPSPPPRVPKNKAVETIK